MSAGWSGYFNKLLEGFGLHRPVELTAAYGTDPAQWRWGAAHPALSVDRPFGNVPAVARSFGVIAPSHGDSYTVYVGQYNAGEAKGPFVNRHAASLRAVYGLADLEQSRFIYQTGQSGLVFAPRSPRRLLLGQARMLRDLVPEEIGVVALVQQDMKKLVAYSSVAHMGFVTLGFFVFNPLGVTGGLLQMIAHGFVSGAMFLCIGVLYDRVHSREISAYGGVANTMPRFAAFALLFFMANCGLPGTAGFVGEWTVILGAVQANFWIGLLAATALISGAAYTLWMFKRV